MLQVFLFALVLGGGLLAVSLFSDGGDGDLEHDVHFGEAFKFLSLRALIYFFFTFGGVGTALTLAWRGPAFIVLAAALASGIGVSALTSLVFRYLRRTDSGQREGDSGFVGLPGRMVVPIGSAGVGKVLVQRGGRSHELLARPFGSEAEQSTPLEWQSVVVVDMRGSTALVSPVEELPSQVP